MKKYLTLGLLVLAVVGMYVGFFLSKVTQTSLMEDAVMTVEAYQENGDAGAAVETLAELTRQLTGLKEKGGPSKEKEDAEMAARADRARGELANVSMELEISDKEQDQKVSQALNKFMSQ